ncbi:unnamed protein product [Leuciscus chuanchicus]
MAFSKRLQVVVKVDGVEVCRGIGVEEGILAAFSAYYVFNLAYPPYMKNTLTFLQHAIAKITEMFWDVVSKPKEEAHFIWLDISSEEYLELTEREVECPFKEDSENMSDPEPCRMKHTEDPEEQRDLIEKSEESEKLSEVEEEHHVKPGEKPLIECIHPSSTYLGPSHGGSSLSRDAQTSLSRHFFQLFWGDTEAFPGQPGDIVPPACPRSSPGYSPSGTCPEHLPRKVSRRHL